MPIKLYNTEKDTRSTVAEPIMAYRAATVNSSPNPATLLHSVLPCCMSIDELKFEVQQSIEDAQNGLGITLEQAKSRHLR